MAYIDLIVTMIMIAIVAVITKELWGWDVDLGVTLAAIAFVRVSRMETNSK